MPRAGAEIDQWERLDTYRQRYPIDRKLAPVLSLENSINRRRARASALTRRLHGLEEQLNAVRTELGAVEAEIRGSRVTGALLIDEIIEQVRNETGEGLVSEAGARLPGVVGQGQPDNGQPTALVHTHDVE